MRLGANCRSVLEPGCGSDRVIAALARHGLEVVDLDRSAQMVELQPQDDGHRRRYLGVPLVAGRSGDLMFDNLKFAKAWIAQADRDISPNGFPVPARISMDYTMKYGIGVKGPVY